LKVIIPRLLLDELENLHLTSIGFRYAIEFYSHYLSFSFQFKENNFCDTYLPISSAFIKINYTTNYFNYFLGALLKKNIVTRAPYFSSKYSGSKNGGSRNEDKPFSYKFRNDLLDFSDLVTLEYTPRSQNATNRNTRGRKNIKYVINDLKKLKFDNNAMLSTLGKLSIKPVIITNRNIMSNEQITVTGKNGRKFRMDKETALMESKLNSVDLIEYKGEYFMMDESEFIKYKTLQLQLCNCFAVCRILNGDFYGKRNLTNFRLDTNLTCLNKIFFDRHCIRLEDERLIEIDLKNSQPSLLAFLLKNPTNIKKFKKLKNITIPAVVMESDAIKFITLAEDGLLYDYMSNEIGETRERTKKVFLKIMFSKPGWNDVTKTKIKKIFPTIIQWMDDFKKAAGDHRILAIVLQRIESEIFIDRIYRQLRKKRFIIYTKHDCILCRESDSVAVRDIVINELTTIGMKFMLSK
jgi:hypothetical protein